MVLTVAAKQPNYLEFRLYTAVPDSIVLPWIFQNLYDYIISPISVDMSAELHHPFLGIVRGRAGDGVVQYLGVKYALLRDRFAEPELCTSYGSKSLDATFLGYTTCSL